jgi:hypothetical protein
MDIVIGEFVLFVRLANEGIVDVPEVGLKFAIFAGTPPGTLHKIETLPVGLVKFTAFVFPPEQMI